MAGFGGKKAAPFVKGGGRSSTHPNDARGNPKKALAKAEIAKKARLVEKAQVEKASRA